MMQINFHATVEILSWYFVTDKEWLECKGSNRLFKRRIDQSIKQTNKVVAVLFFLLLFQFQVKSKQTPLVVRKMGWKFLRETFLLIILTISKSLFKMNHGASV